jgi:predicted porin
MKKTLLTALALGFVAGGVSARSNVIIYGVADAGLVRESGGPAGATTNISSGVSSGNRLGFKGKEDLGGGVSAVFLLENGYNIDTGSQGQGGLLFGRQAYVGLTGAMGTLTIGRQYSPHYKLLRDVADPFSIGLAGNAANVIVSNTRVDNAVEYVSPKFGGVYADIMIGAGEVAGDTARNRTLGASVGYAQGPLHVALSHHQRNNAVATDRTRNLMLVAKYGFSMAEVNVGYVRNRALLDAKSEDMLIGVTVPLGAGRILASYIRHDDSTPANRDADQWAIGYVYKLSKRSELYAAYGHIGNEQGAQFKVGNGTDAGSGNSAANLGIKHVF